MRRALSAASALAVVAVLPLVTTTAEADPISPPAPAPDTSQQPRPDDLTHPLDVRRRAERQEAVDQLAGGEARLRGRGAHRTIQLADGTEVDYPATETAQLLTFLVEFGNDPDGIADPTWPTEGPVHGEIPEPPAEDNATYWEPSFDRDHYQDLFFGDPDEPGAESMRGIYQEMSSGRFDLEGDVSDWVQVDHPASYYSEADGSESSENMADFVGDSAQAWYDAALAERTGSGMDEAAAEEDVATYLQKFDVWDRYDLDGDGDIHEPDGYIDHFQAIHAGEDESGGGPTWAIWAHRGGANYAGFGVDGPTPSADCSACYPAGGVPIGDSGLWVLDYTTEPENGGLGVFAHEFGHDLGLRDYYDYGDGESTNSAFWTLMDSGSWLSDGVSGQGTGPVQIGAPDKYYLGWYGAADLAAVDGLGDAEDVVLGPSHHATRTGAQALLVDLPDGTTSYPAEPNSLDGFHLQTPPADNLYATAAGPEIRVPEDDPVLTARVAFDIEEGWDYAYLLASVDGGSPEPVATSLSTTDDPHGQNLGQGITGSSSGWQTLTADLTEYAGEDVALEWVYLSDGNTHGWGLAVDALQLGAYTTDFASTTGWDLSDFYPAAAGTFDVPFSRYYLAENRQYAGYDASLETGPYMPLAMGTYYPTQYFAYEDGLLVWFHNGAYSDNNISLHPGGAVDMPVDANPALVMYDDEGLGYYAHPRLATYDATFDVEPTDALSMTVGYDDDDLTVEVPERPGVPVFDDADPDGYLDPTGEGGDLPYAIQVAGVGTMIQVVSSDESTGRMVLRAGKRFVAATEQPTVTGSAVVGQTLTATAPTWFQDGVTAPVTWLRDGTPIAGAAGPTYQVAPADLGHAVSASFTGTKSGYQPTTATSEELRVGRGAAPTAASAPTITGTPQVGATLSAAGATWPLAGTSTYSWSVGGTTVGTGPSYVVRPADLGSVVSLSETRTTDGYQDATAAASSAPITIGAAPAASAPPTISGRARVGATLSVAGATWPWAGTSTFAWSVDGKAVGSGPSYDVRPGDAGRKVTVTETLTSAGHAAGSASAVTGSVAEAPVRLRIDVRRATRGKKVGVTIQVTSPGPDVPGSVRISYAGDRLDAERIKDGEVSLKLPARKKGTYRLKVTYPGATGFADASGIVKVKVR